jgi:hypothetical protein
MAKLTKDGRVQSSGQGSRGLQLAWSLLGRWIERDLPAQVAKANAARRGH